MRTFQHRSIPDGTGSKPESLRFTTGFVKLLSYRTRLYNVDCIASASVFVQAELAGNAFPLFQARPAAGTVTDDGMDQEWFFNERGADVADNDPGHHIHLPQIWLPAPAAFSFQINAGDATTYTYNSHALFLVCEDISELL